MICRKRTADKTTWTPEAQAAALFQNKFETPVIPQYMFINDGNNLNILISDIYALDLRPFLKIEPEEASKEVTWKLDFVSGNFGTNGITIDPVTSIITISQSTVDSTTVFNLIATSVANPSLSATIVLTLLAN